MENWSGEVNINHPAGRQKNKSFLFRSRFGLNKYVLLLLFIWGGMLLQVGPAQAQIFSPPPEPDVRPFIVEMYSTDLNRNAIDDELETKSATAMDRLQSAVTSKEITEAESLLKSPIEIELIFKEQITQQQIDDFLSHGGEITYLYKAVSYGWNGRIALGNVSVLPALMGPTMVLVKEAKPLVLHLDVATRNGRVRPVWTAGFAGNPSGFDGSGTITIAVVDTGIDAAHSDLAGRQVYWHDFSSDAASSPVDIIGHGSHVSGIAFGTGAAGGSSTGTLYYTDTGNLTGFSSGWFYFFSIDLPSTSLTYSSTARWIGGGST